MATGFFRWSRTADSNANATYTWADGMAPSSVNDSARGIMSDAAQWRDDISGAIVTGGTSTAYTVTSYSVFDSLANMNGQMIAFSPHATSAVSATLNVDGLGAKPLRSVPGVDLPSGTLVQGTPYCALYNNSDGAFYVYGIGYNPGVPLGVGLDYWGGVAPSSDLALAYGQAISRTTYAALFSLFGTAYGPGDGSTTFNIPDCRGCVTAKKDDMGGSAASRLTSTYFGTSAATLGAVGGGESQTLVTANLPAYTPAGTISNGAITITHNAAVNGGGSSTPGGAFPLNNTGAASISASQAASSFTGTAQGGTSTPMKIVQPTIVCNYIIRII